MPRLGSQLCNLECNLHGPCQTLVVCTAVASEAKAATAREAKAAQAAAARLAAEVAEPIDESYHVVFSSRRGVLDFLGGGLQPVGRGDGVPVR